MIKDKKEKQSGGSSSTSSGGGTTNNSNSSSSSGEGRSSSGGGSNSKNNSNNTNNSSNSNASNTANASSNNNSGGNNNSSTSSPSSSKTSSSSNSGSSKSGSNNLNKNNILGIKEEIIEQGPTEQLIVTSIKHEDGSPPTNIIKKEPANSASTSGNSSGSNSTSTVNSNDSNNNNDTNDNKNSSNLSNSGNLLQDEKDSANDNSITDELLNNDELNASGSGGNNTNSSKLGMHIKSEDPIADPLGDGNLNSGNFGNMNPQQSGSNRPMIPQSSPERIQPLPSNIINKQSNSMDYMQQQSQIFVFSTALANKGAEAVRSGQFSTIIAYHCAQPETRKFLQKFPLKVNQFNRSGPGWFPPNMPANMNSNKRSKMMPMNQQNFGNFMKNNSMNPQQTGQQGGQGPMNNHQMGGMMSNQGPGGNNFQPSCDINNELWGAGNHSMNMDPSLDPLLGDPIDSLVNDPLTSNLPQGNLSGPNSCGMDPTSPNTIPSLQGVKVPDEDLTPQQRHQRAMKLAHLQELKQLFKQEHPMNPNDINQMNDQDSSMPGNGPACSKMGPNAMNPMMQSGNNASGGNVVAGSGGMMNMSPHGPMNPGMNMNGPMRPNFPPGMGMGPRGPMGNMNINMNRPMGPMMSPDDMMSGGGPCGPTNMMGPMNSGNLMGGMPPQHMQPNNMGMGPGSCMQMPGNNSGPMGMGQKGNMPPGSGGNMHMDWNNKMQQPQYYDDNNKRNKGPVMPPNMDEMNPGIGMGRMPPNAMRNMPNMRGPPQQQQGPPPPPYHQHHQTQLQHHQTPRSASVPIATQSPNPNSPNNPTSNLSLPSPRGNSALNSPAASGDPSRMNPQQQQQFKHMNARQSPTTSSQDSPAMSRQINHSNPSTPISSHLSPSASLKDLEMSTNPSQELTIQKQPNNNMNKDGNPNLGPNLDNRLPGQKTPTSTSNPHMNNFSIPSSPHAGSLGDKNRLSSGSQNNLQRSNSMMGNDPTQFPNHPQGGNQQSNESNMQFPDAPNMPFANVSQNKMQNFMDQKPGDNVVGPFPSCGGRPENLPLNPNSNAAMPSTKPSHFDPISSLAQMSQQLTSTGVPGSMNGQQMMGPFNNNGMMNDMGGPMGMGDGSQMDFGGNMGMNQFPMNAGPRSMSPKIGPQMGGFPPNGPGPGMRMVRPPMGPYNNGTNIQVKPNAPNTIQYLPARPQMNNSNPPRGPPSLEFLQRYTNPMGMDEMKGAPNIGGVGNNPQNNMPYFPNQNNPNACMVDPMVDGSPGNNGPPGMMNQNPMMMRGGGGAMRGGNMNMRFPGPNNPCMMGNNNPQFNSSNPNMSNPEAMMFGGPNPGQNPQMFVAGPKSSPLPQPNSDMQQMMVGGGGNIPHFNKQQQQQQPPQQSHFSNASDPNYAQQYHNFQQQLYATNNTNNQRMGMGNQAPPFMPK
ncbi:hypothetical protein PVAND_010747 [Polypedilum vanderplanki]|uniref:B-cell lymphoma 9 beta-catenin binding domain-containing protein n=1 Tax=Polypedilum vanderplanki TaxID=319348 RepID=A0A9J6CHG3_POLVA|nr:hypothetical protein PVAND_010747 [Polypedilum vanderplanki]